MNSTQFNTKLLTILILVFVSFMANCTTPVINNQNSPNQVFVVSSLNADGTSKVTLTITIASNNAAIVTKVVTPAGPTDEHIAYIVGNSLSFSGDFLDTMEIDVTNGIPGLQRFWIDFDLIDPPSVTDGGSKLSFYCISYNCETEDRCEPTMMGGNNNQVNVRCTNPCQRCVLKHFTTPGVNLESGGVYIYANSVTYQ